METTENNSQAAVEEKNSGRAPASEVTAAHRKASEDRALSTLQNVITDFVLVLNNQRQIVAVNQALLSAFGLNADALLGMRPGEAFGCIYSCEGADGCGTGTHCAVCGAHSTYMAAQSSEVQVVGECRLTIGRGQDAAFDLEVVATPYSHEDESFLICTLRDISASKRRNILERIFFHDVINTAGGIHGLASILVENESLPREKDQEFKGWMHSLSLKLIDEINQQRHLLAAEKGEYLPARGEFSIGQVLEDVRALYTNHVVAEGKTLVIEEEPGGSMISDETVVRRVLGNLVKNALEATEAGGVVTISAYEKGAEVRFSVHNETVMPETVRLQIFQRSFSTKAANGRGIGAYSVKLFTERYLKGKVEFISREPEGTIFSVIVPRETDDFSASAG